LWGRFSADKSTVNEHLKELGHVRFWYTYILYIYILYHIIYIYIYIYIYAENGESGQVAVRGAAPEAEDALLHAFAGSSGHI